ncbi:MAG: alpha-1,2-fucosyltransferase [Denitromonas halophila]|nr:MAG: alpha-1,2-fucosyltransferase [Denitromonas halophila]
MSRPAKVISMILGGLGNQLFCYAAARRLAIVNDAELVLDDISGFEMDHLYRRSFQLDRFNIVSRKATWFERMEPAGRLRRKISRVLAERIEFSRRKYVYQKGVDFDPRLLTLRFSGDLYLHGNWQSFRYFFDIEDVLRRDLEMVPPRDVANLSLCQKIESCESVAVHYRFFDQGGGGGVNNISKDYYRRAMEAVELISGDVVYFVFSDRPDLARSSGGFPERRTVYVDINEGVDSPCNDLWLMSKCQSFIIANSTFSWWGAWLGNRPGKIVVAPGARIQGGVMNWGFEGLLPESWIRC